MIAALGLRYGTEEATDFSEKVHRSLHLAAYRSSVSMAKERGAFSIFDAGREVDNPFINRLKKEDEELYRDMCKYGRLNIIRSDYRNFTGNNELDDTNYIGNRTGIYACFIAVAVK